MGNEINIEAGRLVESSIEKSQLNAFEKVQYQMPFHTMMIYTYECRLKKYVY